MTTSDEKLDELIFLLRDLGGAALAFSGGVDSTFLLAACKRAMGNRVLAVICLSPTFPKRELDAAYDLARLLGARYRVVKTDEMSIDEFRMNPPTRCFHCKTSLFTAVKAVAAEEALSHVIEGTNADDADDYRPGREALKRLRIRSPLLEVGLGKQEIRELSRKMSLPTWDKPSMACLASRIPYGEEITMARLARIETAEDSIKDLGFSNVRVRDHGDVARIEVSPDRISELASKNTRKAVSNAAKSAGYKYVSLDLDGYRTGAMNEALDPKQRGED